MLKLLRPIYGRFNQYRGHSLRGRTIIKSSIPETKFETLTFKHFFPRLLKTFKHFDFTLRKDSFKTQVNLYLRENIKLFLNKFPKFDTKYSAYYHKKKKNLSKLKRLERNEEICLKILNNIQFIYFSNSFSKSLLFIFKFVFFYFFNLFI